MPILDLSMFCDQHERNKIAGGMPLWPARATAHQPAVPGVDSKRNSRHEWQRGEHGPAAVGKPGARWDFPFDTSDRPLLGCHGTLSAPDNRETTPVSGAKRTFGL